MSNVNYTGSSAERFMDFSSKLQSVSETRKDLFNSIEIFVPASLATANVKDYKGVGLEEGKPIVKTVTVDNYKDVMTGKLYEQWEKFFMDGTNIEAIVYLVIFYDTGFATVTDPATIAEQGLTAPIAYKPLDIAFHKLYNLAYFKTLFFTDYTGETSLGEEPYNLVNQYFDMSLCLSALCEAETKLSMFLAFYTPDLAKVTYEASAISGDTNKCQILSVKEADEIKAATKFDETTPDNRAKNYWGYLRLIGGKRTAIMVNNGVYVDPIRLGVWMEKKNDSRTYIGNKLAKIKLTDKDIKPTGLPNEVEENVNNNLDYRIAQVVDPKHVAYLLSISDASQNHAMIIDDKTVSGFPINADMIAKYIDYTCSQTLAEYTANISTLDRPILVNRKTYSYIQTLVGNVIQRIARTGRLSNILINFPPYEEAKQGNRFVGKAAWSAVYTDDLAGVKISGNISF